MIEQEPALVDQGTEGTAGETERVREEVASSLLRDAWVDLRRNPVFLVSLFCVSLLILIAIVPGPFAGLFGHGNPLDCNLSYSNRGPMAGHPFGFDEQGCDVYANVIYGTRDSISIGLLVTASSLVVAVLLGSAAGYYRKVVDAVVSRLSDVFFGFPFILGALVLLSTIKGRNVFTVSLVLMLFTWPVLTRLMRARVLSVREMDYLLAARSLGAGDWRVLRKHVIPNAIAPVIVITMITVGSVIAAESALTFLGVGLQSPAISWGLQLSNAQSDFQGHPHLLIAPGAFLSVTVLSFILLGDALQDALDPRSR